jgi:hypothetical protein
MLHKALKGLNNKTSQISHHTPFEALYLSSAKIIIEKYTQ